MTRVTGFLFLAVAILIVTTGAHCAPVGDRTHVLQDLESNEPDVRTAAAEHILRYRDVDHAAIKDVAERHMQSGVGAVSRDALRLLGKLGAREEVPYLVSRLDYAISGVLSDNRLPSIATTFPAAGALIDIGLPSIKPVLSRLAGEKSQDALLAGAGVLRHVLGRAAAIKRFRAELDAASTPEAKDAFRRILGLFDREFLLQ